MQNAAHVAHSVWLSVALAAIQKEASQQRGWEEKRSECNVHGMGKSGKMSRRVVFRRSMEVAVRWHCYSWGQADNRQTPVKCPRDDLWKTDYSAEFPQLTEKLTSEWEIFSYRWEEASVCFAHKKGRLQCLFKTTVVLPRSAVLKVQTNGYQPSKQSLCCAANYTEWQRK